MAPLTSPGQSRAIALLAVSVIFTILPIIFVCLRFWARKMKNAPLKANDYYIVVALVFTLGYDSNLIIATILGGSGQHVGRLSVDELTVLGKTFLVATTMWPCANTFAKLSILDFYYRTFPNRKLRIGAVALGTATICYCIATVVTALSICRPIEFNWNKLLPNGKCGSVSKYYLSTGIINLLIDFCIVTLPMPMLWGLQMKTTRKVALTFIFGMGFFICIISILRVVAIQRLDYTDLSYNIVLDSMWTLLEPTLGVVSACLPMLQPVASKVSNSTFFSYARGKSSKGSTAAIWPSKDGQNSGSRGKNFRRIQGNDYSLTDLCTIENEISGDAAGSQSVSRTQSESSVNGPKALDKIKVKKVWAVQSRNAE